MLVYDWLSEIACSGHAVHIQIDLPSKTLLYKTIPIVQNGKLMVEKAPLSDDSVISLDGLIMVDGDSYAEIDRLYASFKQSVPGKRERLNKGNFKAVSSDSLSYQELEGNTPRLEARLKLEGYILLAASAGFLKWENPKHFFRQGADRDLILYREWIV